ncbi:hypothetical protein V8F06_008285 [Rhypophila decipiens]
MSSREYEHTGSGRGHANSYKPGKSHRQHTLRGDDYWNDKKHTDRRHRDRDYYGEDDEWMILDKPSVGPQDMPQQTRITNLFTFTPSVGHMGSVRTASQSQPVTGTPQPLAQINSYPPILSTIPVRRVRLPEPLRLLDDRQLTDSYGQPIIRNTVESQKPGLPRGRKFLHNVRFDSSSPKIIPRGRNQSTSPSYPDIPSSGSSPYPQNMGAHRPRRKYGAADTLYPQEPLSLPASSVDAPQYRSGEKNVGANYYLSETSLDRSLIRQTDSSEQPISDSEAEMDELIAKDCRIRESNNSSSGYSNNSSSGYSNNNSSGYIISSKKADKSSKSNRSKRRRSSSNKNSSSMNSDNRDSTANRHKNAGNGRDTDDPSSRSRFYPGKADSDSSSSAKMNRQLPGAFLSMSPH